MEQSFFFCRVTDEQNMSQQKIIVGTQYFGNIEFFTYLNRADEVLIEVNDHFEKQTLRNRTTILGANGPLHLIVPLLRRGQRIATKDVKIENEHLWQRLHWRSLESAYRRSAYFEYYEHHLEPFFTQEYTSLLELNTAIFIKLCALLNIEKPITYTQSYEKSHLVYTDLRRIGNPKNNQEIQYPEKPYIQVFEDRNGFVANASILDLLFSEGPRSKDFL
jgi:hypothetical protein